MVAIRVSVLELSLNVIRTLSLISLGKFSMCGRESGFWNLQTYIQPALEEGSLETSQGVKKEKFRRFVVLALCIASLEKKEFKVGRSRAVCIIS